MQSLTVIFSKRYQLILFHIIFLLILILACRNSGIKKYEVHEDNLVTYDASWYNSIKENGYLFKEDTQSNSGYYPAFPYLWKVTSLSPLGISILNAVIFFFAFYLLAKNFDFNIKESLLMLSVPSLMFNYVPYTEALFSLFAVIFLIGLLKKNFLMQILAVFFCCLIRPVSIIFIPAIIFIELVSSNENREKIIKTSTCMFISILALFIVASIQWIQTGVWMAYYKAQYVQWDRAFHVPRFPLTTWVGPRTIWVDGTAFWLGLLAIGFCLTVLFLRKKVDQLGKPLLFSLAYLSGVTLLVFLFDGYNDRGSTTVMGLNRYFFATPFFFIAFQKFLRLPQLSNKNYLYILASLIFVWLLFGAYTEIDWFNRWKTIVYFSLLTATVFGCVLVLNHQWFLKKNVWVLLYIGNCLLQTYLLFRFLSGEWVG